MTSCKSTFQGLVFFLFILMLRCLGKKKNKYTWVSMNS